MPSFAWSCCDRKARSLRDDMTVAKVSMTTDSMDTEAVYCCISAPVTDTVSDAVVSKIPLKEKDIVTGMVMMEQSVWAVHHEKSSVQAYPVTLPHQPQTLPISCVLLY